MSRLSSETARDILQRCQAADRDFHALPSASVERLLVEAREHGYRTPRNAPGSRARMFHQHVSRVAARKE